MELIRTTTDCAIQGFRAPHFSLTKETRWILPILARLGFRYDSSIFPIRTGEYGVRNAPRSPYPISLSDITKQDVQSKILEIPLAVAKLGPFTIPVAGGVFFRLIPLRIFKTLLKKTNQIPVLYFHPHELYEKTPRAKSGPIIKRFLKYYGVKNSFGKLESLISEFSPISVAEWLRSA